MIISRWLARQQRREADGRHERWRRRRRQWGFGPHPGLTASASSKMAMIAPCVAVPRARRRTEFIALDARELQA